MSYVARRKLKFQQLENALGTPLPAVIKCYATLRDAKFAESSYDKVVMWTGGSYDYDDVVRALVRLDRPEMRPGTSGQKRQDHTDISQNRKWMHRQSFQVPNYGRNQVWTYHTGTRFSTHCKRTSISAMGAFHDIVQGFLKARVIAVAPKIQVVMATVVSRLLLHAGVWDPLSAAQIRKLNTVYMRALRAAMGKDRGPHLNVTDLAVRIEAGVPSISTVVRRGDSNW